MDKKQIILPTLIFPLFLVIVQLLVSGCAANGNETQYVPDIQILSAKYHWPQALELAKNWHPDAYISEARIHVQLPQDPASKDVVYFGARTPSYEKKVLHITCRRECQSEELTTTVVLPQCQPIHLDDIAISGEEALRIGLANGGSSMFYDKHVFIMVLLERYPTRCFGKNVVWSASFVDEITGERIWVFVDARSGEVLEIDE